MDSHLSELETSHGVKKCFVMKHGPCWRVSIGALPLQTKKKAASFVQVVLNEAKTHWVLR